MSARPVKANTARLKWRADGSLAKTLTSPPPPRAVHRYKEGDKAKHDTY